MENLSNLLKETFSVELSRTNKGILSQENMFTSECRVEAILRKKSLLALKLY